MSSNTFHCYEFFLLKKSQEDPELWNQLKENLSKADRSYKIGSVPQELWFLAVTLEKAKDRFTQFITDEIKQEEYKLMRASENTLLSTYLNSNHFVQLELDSIFKYGENNTLPREIFKCPAVKYMSLRYNYLDSIPPDIGRLKNLEYLALTNNKLQNKSIPYTLTFCEKLEVLLLDNNLLDALPGFLLDMDSLHTVHRHGNHNYFKATFMWYHTDVNDRVIKVAGIRNFPKPERPESLQFLAAKAVISAKMNFFQSKVIPTRLKDFIADIYEKYNICGYCLTAQLLSESGYKVITFKNPYLGNTCVPFQHWACSQDCAESIEIPARVEQITSAIELDKQYEMYVRESQHKCGCTSRDTTSSFGCIVL